MLGDRRFDLEMEHPLTDITRSGTFQNARELIGLSEAKRAGCVRISRPRFDVTRHDVGNDVSKWVEFVLLPNSEPQCTARSGGAQTTASKEMFSTGRDSATHCRNAMFVSPRRCASVPEAATI